jgi:NAD(P)-dependent dehydrogenase (short-subunit alcohol dehydrogenase family)
VNVASVAGLLGVADRSAYQASKHGLNGLARTLAAERGGRGVRVNSRLPRVGEDGDGHADQAAGGHTDADIIDRVPIGRLATRSTSPPRWLTWPTPLRAVMSTATHFLWTAAGTPTAAGRACGCATADRRVD